MIGKALDDNPTTSRQLLFKDPKSLKPRSRNPRTHSKRQLEQIASSIRAFGFINPVLIDGQDAIIAGHGRVAAAISLGMEDIPTFRVDHLSPPQIRAYVIADNKIAENAGWDRELLALELRELSVEVDFQVTDLGFETAEVDLLISELDGGVSDEADAAPAVNRQNPPISKTGELWKIGPHFLYCGDATDLHSYERLLQGSLAEAVFADPPYNVPIPGHASGLGITEHPNFPMASGEMDSRQFTAFLRKSFENMIAASIDGSLHNVCMDWRVSLNPGSYVLSFICRATRMGMLLRQS